jgi:hypothetical protein
VPEPAIAEVNTAEKNQVVEVDGLISEGKKAGCVMTPVRRIFAALAGVVLIWGFTFTAFYFGVDKGCVQSLNWIVYRHGAGGSIWTV